MRKVKVLIDGRLEYLKYAKRTTTGGYKYDVAGEVKSFISPVALHNMNPGKRIELDGKMFTIL